VRTQRTLARHSFANELASPTPTRPSFRRASARDQLGEARCASAPSPRDASALVAVARVPSLARAVSLPFFGIARKP